MSLHVFVTGATGVLGRRAVSHLVAAGHFVTAVARTPQKADDLRARGANPVSVDLFDRVALERVLRGHDVVAQLATNIPTGAAAALPWKWRTNDRLRRDAAQAIAAAAIACGVERMVQESITFPYVDCGERWIDEATERGYFWGNRTTVDAENAAARVTSAGGTGVVLRFAMFAAPDSAHVQAFVSAARRGVFGLFGRPDAYISFIHADDAAAAVVAALDVRAGTYNVAEAEPARRDDHCEHLAAAVGRATLRSVPRIVTRAGGEGADSLARSHRISSTLLQSESSWRPVHRGLDIWRETCNNT